MTRIHREAHLCHDGVQYQSTWQGTGWDKIPSEWLFYTRESKWVATLGKIRLRILKETHSWTIYIVQENWRWPLWWVILRVWLALCWFERNLRMTAAIWGLLHRPEPGCMPFWSDFIILYLLRGRKARGSTC